MCLDESEVNLLLKKINAQASAGHVLLCDILGTTLLESPFMKNQLQFLAGLGARWKFGSNEPEKFMHSLGWEAKATQPGEFLPSRWPFPTPPRHIPNVRRSFFVEARKKG